MTRNADLLTAEIHTDRGLELVGVEHYDGEPVRVWTAYDCCAYGWDEWCAASGAWPGDVYAVRRRCEVLS